MSSSSSTTPSIEAKLVVLGSQAVGKTSLVHRFVHQSFVSPEEVVSTVGASFISKKVTDADSGTLVRLQIWDTAGQERFRSISKLYYRGSNAAILCYDITSPASFTEISHWLHEIRANLPEDAILHIVGTKADLVAEDPSKRRVPFESVVAYAAEHLYPSSSSTITPKSNRSSSGGGFWGLETGWDSCHEVSASTGEGVEEVFRVLTRRLVEQRNARLAVEQAESLGQNHPLANSSRTPDPDSRGGYFDESSGSYNHNAGGSFRIGIGDKRRSWLGLPQFPITDEPEGSTQDNRKQKAGPCCGG
jgi:small GTP-binding protein